MDIAKELTDLLTSEQVLTSDDDLILYGQDWTRYYTPNPSAIVFPKSTEETQKIVKWANQNSIALVPSGGRTGLSGGAVAKNGEVVVAMDKMNKINTFNETNLTIHCGAGVITEELQNFAIENGYYFPVDFASRGSSQIGGNIATNAGGIKVIRYGLMREWVSGLTVVTGQGEILKLNNSLIKNATGYDLRHLFIGSEGTLGFITEAELKVTTQPKNLSVMVVGVPDLDSVMNIFSHFRKSTPLTAFELYTDVALDIVLESFSNLNRPFETKCPIYLLIEYENTTSDVETKALETFETCCEKGWINDGVIAQNEQQSKDFWALRENIAEAASHGTPYKNDISVTIDRVPEFMQKSDDLLKNQYPEFKVVWFGHIGDGNLHISILKPQNLEMEEFVQQCQNVDKILFESIQSLGGSISAEHGVGLSKKPFLNYTKSTEEIAYMRQIKNTFDPKGILNPGKIF